MVFGIISESRHMKHKPFGNSLMVPLAAAAVTGVLTLTLSPDLVPGTWRILAWIATSAAAAGAGAVWIRGRAAKRAADKENTEKRHKRAERRIRQRAEQEARIKEGREKAAQKEAKLAAKRAEEKAAMVKRAKTVWAERAEKALAREAFAREVIAKATKMPIREAAGQTATEWAAAATLAKWTSQQIIALTDRPDVKADARTEAREAIMEAARIKERGGVWTEAQGDALVEIREKARMEAKAEEARQDEVRDVVQKAEAEWKIAEVRATRAEAELKMMASRNK